MGFRKGNFVEEGISYPCYIQVFGNGLGEVATFCKDWAIQLISLDKVKNYMSSDIWILRANSDFGGSFLVVGSPEAYKSLTGYSIHTVNKELIFSEEGVNNIFHDILPENSNLFVPDKVSNSIKLGIKYYSSTLSVFERGLIKKLQKMGLNDKTAKKFLKRIEANISSEMYSKYLSYNHLKGFLDGKPFWFKDEEVFPVYDRFSYLVFYDSTVGGYFTFGKDGCKYYLKGISDKFIEEPSFTVEDGKDGKEIKAFLVTSEKAKHISGRGIDIWDVHPKLLLSPEESVNLNFSSLDELESSVSTPYQELPSGEECAEFVGLVKGTSNTYLYHNGDNVIKGFVEVEKGEVDNLLGEERIIVFNTMDVFKDSPFAYLDGNVSWRGRLYESTFHLYEH